MSSSGGVSPLRQKHSQKFWELLGRVPTFGLASASSPVRGNIDLWKETRSILGMGVPS